MYNYKLKKENIEELTKELFKEGIYLAYEGGINDIAPLGECGDDIILHGKEAPGRFELVSLRNYCGDCQLLITDQEGHFLFYGRFDVDLGLDFMLDRYWDIFQKVKSKIKTKVGKTIDFDACKRAENVTYSKWFQFVGISPTTSL